MKHTSSLLRVGVLILALSIIACGPAATSLRKSKKLESAGLTYEAASAALDAVEANPSHTKAIVQAKSLTTREVKRLLIDFENRADQGETVGALEAFVSAQQLTRRAEQSGLQIIGIENHLGRYASLRKGHVQEIEALADKALEKEDFEGAKRLYENALRYDEENATLRSQWRIATAEPLYRVGQQLYANKRFRAAYMQWAEMEKSISSHYKNGRSLQDSAVKHGKVSVGVRDVIAPTRQELELARGLRADLLNQLIATQDPFIEWIDYNEQQRFSATQQPDMVLSMEMTQWMEIPGTSARFERQGFRKELVKTKDPVTGVETTKEIFTKVVYYDINYRFYVRGTLMFQLEDIAQKKVLASREVSDQEERTVASAEFSGDPTALYPGLWASPNNGRNTDIIHYNQRGELESRFRTTYNPRLIDQMREKVKDSLMRKASNVLYETLKSNTFIP